MATKTPVKPDAARCAAVFGCTIEQAKRQLKKNAEGLLWMAERAAKTGKKYNGYTEAELRQSAADYAAAAK